MTFYSKAAQWQAQRDAVFVRDNHTCRVCKCCTAFDVYHSCGRIALVGDEPHEELLAVCKGCRRHLRGFVASGLKQTYALYTASVEIAINKDGNIYWCEIRKACQRCDGHASYSNSLCSDCLRVRSGWRFAVDHRSEQQKKESHTPEGSDNEVKIIEDLKGDCDEYI